MDLDRSSRRIDGDWCSELAPGGPYFFVTYPEGGVNLPQIETLVYLGSCKDDGQLSFFFQKAESYHRDGDWSALSDDVRNELATDVMCCGEDAIGDIADIDGLLVLLSDLREHMRLGLGWDRALPHER